MADAKTTLSDECQVYTPRVFNSTTRARFTKDRREGLIRQLGGTATRAQLTLIQRIVRNEWDLLRLDQRMDQGDLSSHAMRTRLAMENRLRLDIRDLCGLKGAKVKPPSIFAALADRAREDAA